MISPPISDSLLFYSSAEWVYIWRRLHIFFDWLKGWSLLGEKEILERLRDDVVRFDKADIREACKAALEAGIPPEKAILEGLAKGMDIVGGLYEEDEYFLPELIMAAETMNEGTSILKPHIKADKVPAPVTVVIGTVKGDIHDIGKNIVKNLLEAAGFIVQDVGVDVDADDFVEAVKKRCDIVAMSALMTSTMRYMKDVIQALKRAGIREKVKVLVGGAPVDEEFARRIGADAYGEDAIAGVEIVKRWVASTPEMCKD